MGAGALAYMTRPHVIPVGGDEPVHWCSSGCWCQPLVDVREGPFQMETNVIHHAKDLREARERRGNNHPNEVWVIVLEEYEPVE